MHAQSKIILLNGHSGVGKTTIAKCLEKQKNFVRYESKQMAVEFLQRMFSFSREDSRDKVIWNGLTIRELTVLMIDGFMENEEIYRKMNKSAQLGVLHRSIASYIADNYGRGEAGLVPTYHVVDSVANKRDVMAYVETFGSLCEVNIVQISSGRAKVHAYSSRELMLDVMTQSDWEHEHYVNAFPIGNSNLHTIEGVCAEIMMHLGLDYVGTK